MMDGCFCVLFQDEREKNVPLPRSYSKRTSHNLPLKIQHDEPYVHKVCAVNMGGGIDKDVVQTLPSVTPLPQRAEQPPFGHNKVIGGNRGL